MAMIQHLTVDQGTLFQWDFLVRTNQSTIYDLTDCTIQGQVRKTYDSSTVLLTPTFTVSPALGKITMTILPDDTTALSFTGEETEAVYDIEVHNTISGDVKRIVNGTMTITKEVTRV